MADPANTTPPLTSAQKGFQLLEALAEFSRGAGVSEIGRKLGWTRAVAHRWLVTLVATGWVEQDESGRYRLTMRVVRVMRGALSQSGIDERLTPFLEDLAHRCNETVSISVLDGAEAQIVRRVESLNLLSVNLRVGSRMPLDRSASGLVLVAFSPAPAIDRLREMGAVLPDEQRLEEVRETGMAHSASELELGMSAIAVPVVLQEADFLGALSIAAPTRDGLPKVHEEQLVNARDAIQRYLEGDGCEA